MHGLSAELVISTLIDFDMRHSYRIDIYLTAFLLFSYSIDPLLSQKENI